MKKGFTLVEIMIVVAIIGLLAAIAIPSFMKARATSQKNLCVNNMRLLESAKDQVAIDTGLATGDGIPTNGATSLESHTSLSPFMKTNVYCPVSDSGNAQGTVARAADDYTANNIGTAPTCVYAGGAASDPHVAQ